MSAIRRSPLIEILFRVRYKEVSANKGLVMCPYKEVSANKGLVMCPYKEVSANRDLATCPL